MLTPSEQLSILADLATGNGVGPSTDPALLDPRNFTPGEIRLAIGLAKQGVSFRDAILPDLSTDLVRAFLPDEPDGVPLKHASWADMAAVLGPLEWAWADWLPQSMLSMLVAEQGAGKSVFALRIAACYLRGDPWPDGTPFDGELGGVVWCEAESSQGLNLDRATKWRLPLSRLISPLEDPLDDLVLQDPEHLQRIEHAARRPSARCIIVDSLSGANQIKENDAAMVRPVKALATIAKQVGKPIILTHHLRKPGPMEAASEVTLARIRGSGAIVQPARAVWALDQPDPNSTTRRLRQLKNNVKGVCGGSIGVTIEESGVTFCEAPEPPRQESQRDKAADVLKALLRKGPRRATELQEEIEGAGISWDAAKRAKSGLGIVSRREDGAWWWGLPASTQGGGV